MAKHHTVQLPLFSSILTLSITESSPSSQSRLEQAAVLDVRWSLIFFRMDTPALAVRMKKGGKSPAQSRSQSPSGVPPPRLYTQHPAVRAAPLPYQLPLRAVPAVANGPSFVASPPDLASPPGVPVHQDYTASVNPFQAVPRHGVFGWSKEKDLVIIKAYLAGLDMDLIAQKVILGLTPLEAMSFINTRFARLKDGNILPRAWSKSTDINPGMTGRMGFTVDEDVELLQWVVYHGYGPLEDGDLDTQVFVANNRSAAVLRKRADWLASLPGLVDRARGIEAVARDAGTAMVEHWAMVESGDHCEWCEVVHALESWRQRRTKGQSASSGLRLLRRGA